MVPSLVVRRSGTAPVRPSWSGPRPPGRGWRPAPTCDPGGPSGVGCCVLLCCVCSSRWPVRGPSRGGGAS